jgi:AcrR family transcriptional regulator
MRGPMRSAARKDREGSRERVLAGAIEEFATYGFAGARIDRIARRTKLNVRMLYYHFGSKTGLYRAVLERIYDEAAKILDATDRAQDPTVAALGMYFDLLTAHPRFADVLVRELLDGAKHLRVLFKERPQLFQDIHLRAQNLVVEAQKSGIIRKEDPAMSVFSLTSALCYLTAIRHTHGLFLDGVRPDPAAWKAHLLGIFFDGLRPR